MKPVNHAAVITLLRGLYDPRGRCNRYGLLISAVLAAVFSYGSVATIGGLHFESVLSWIVLSHVLWINIVPCIRRGHDMGYRTLYILIAAPCLIALGVGIVWMLTLALAQTGALDTITPTDPLFWLLNCLVIAPIMGALIWISVAKGQDFTNQYGDVPVSYGLSHPVRHINVVHNPLGTSQLISNPPTD